MFTVGSHDTADVIEYKRHFMHATSPAKSAHLIALWNLLTLEERAFARSWSPLFDPKQYVWDPKTYMIVPLYHD